MKILYKYTALKKRIYILVLFGLVSICQINAQSLTIPSNGYKNSIGTSISTGIFIDKAAVFWGCSVDYSYIINDKIILLFGFAYDQEYKTEKKENEHDVIQTITPNIAFGYALSNKFALGIGLGKGVLDTDNPNQKLKFTSDGNLTAGLLFSITMFSKNHHSIDLGGGIERGLITPETDLTIELGYGYNF
jgi:hypothetical protein